MKPKTVLIVDDEATWREMLRIMLAAEGYNIRQANDGTLALDFLNQNHECHAIVSDTNMPLMSGVTLLKKVREKNPILPFILFFSGLNNSAVTSKQVLEMGATAVLAKDEYFKLVPILASV